MNVLASEEERRRFLERHSLFVFDCDGVLWRGGVAIPGVGKAINYLRHAGKTVLFVTNNATKTREACVEKAKRLLGLENATERDFITSGFACGQYLREHGCTTCYVIGDEGLHQELNGAGIKTLGREDDTKPAGEIDFDPVEIPKRYPEVNGVVVSFDSNVGYLKLAKAAAFVQYADPPPLFVCTNRDPATQLFGKGVSPGAGAFCAFLEVATGASPVLTGKPSLFLKSMLVQRGGGAERLDPKATCFVGDRLGTDITFGNICGFTTLLVLSGVTTLDEAKAAKDPETVPDYVVDSVTFLAPKEKENGAASGVVSSCDGK